jgi:hypothetical protein
MHAQSKEFQSNKRMRGILIKLQDAEACFYFAPLDEM